MAPEDATTVSVFRDGDEWCAVFTRLDAIAALFEGV